MLLYTHDNIESTRVDEQITVSAEDGCELAASVGQVNDLSVCLIGWHEVRELISGAFAIVYRNTQAPEILSEKYSLVRYAYKFTDTLVEANLNDDDFNVCWKANPQFRLGIKL